LAHFRLIRTADFGEIKTELEQTLKLPRWQVS